MALSSAAPGQLGMRLKDARHDESRGETQRVLSYVALACGLAVSYVLLRGSTWQGSTQLHTLMETVASVLAFTVGTMALVRYYSRKSNTFLLVGTGFLGTGLLDGYHAVVTSEPFAASFPSVPASLIPWSWMASRLFLSVLMFASWCAWQRESRLGEKGRIRERTVYLAVGSLTVASFLLFALVPLGRAYFPEIPFHRPQEFGPAFFFLLALIGNLRKGAWRHDPFEHWLVLSLIVGFMGEAVFMSVSGRLFDVAFDAAHLLKKVSYILVLIGLIISMYRLFRRAEEGTEEIAQAHSTLAALLNASDAAAVLLDGEGRILALNEAALEQLSGLATLPKGRREEDYLGLSIYGLLPQRIAARARKRNEEVIRSGRPSRASEERGSDWYETSIYPIFDSSGKVAGVGLFSFDVTELKRAQEELQGALEAERERARRDPLTGVLNHRAIVEELKALLDREQPPRTQAVVMVDIDKLKAANDRYGHTFGDAMIVAVANALKRGKAIVGRYGGDEFAAILPGADREAAEGYLEEVLEELAATTLRDEKSGESIPVRASIGISIWPEDAQGVSDLVEAADAAMYAAKRRRPLSQDGLAPPALTERRALAMVGQLAHILTGAGEIDQKLAAITKRLAEGLGYNAVDISVFSGKDAPPRAQGAFADVSEGLLTSWIASQRGGASRPHPVRRWLEETRRPLVISNIAQEVRLPWTQRRLLQMGGIQSGIVVPMVWQGRTIGSLSVGSKQRAAFGMADIELAVQVADLVTPVVELSTLLQEHKASVHHTQPGALEDASASPARDEPAA